MNVLEKILEEISEVEKEHVTGHKVLYALGATGMATEISSIIRSHMDDVPDNDSGWIPVEERLPEVQEGLEDMYCPEFNVTIKGAKEATTLKYSWDGTWFDDNGIVYSVIAWQPLPEAYHPKQAPTAEHIMSRFTRVE